MAGKKQTASKNKTRPASVGQGWRTTDADEIERRRQRAESEGLRVRAEAAGGALFAVYSVQSGKGRSYRVEFRSPEQPINSCDCPDYEVNGLGTCKHIEAVNQHLRRKRAPARRTGTEVYLDRSDQYGEGPKVRVLWADQLRADDRVRQLLAPFFGAGEALVGKPVDAIPALNRALREARLGPERVRLSEHITPWIERLQRRRRYEADREHFLADVAAGKRDFDVVRCPLYGYQQEGMLHLAFNGRAILADDMGLGKTVQAVAACELLRRLQGVERVLVVSPVSLKTEWEEQIARFTDLPTQLIMGPRGDRLRQYRQPAFFNLVNYEQVLHDGDDIQRLLAPEIIILDEAQRIKNWQTKTADAVKHLSSPYVFVLTGTPLENSIEHRILHLLEQKRSLAEGVLEGTGETEMELPSGRKMLIERLESLMETRLAHQQATAEEIPPAAVNLEDLPRELEARHPQGLEAMAVYGSERGRQTVLAVVPGNTEARRDELASAAARTEARPNVEVVDRDTMAAIQRLIEAGVLSLNAPQQTLYGTLASPARPEGNERRRRGAQAAHGPSPRRGRFRTRSRRPIGRGAGRGARRPWGWRRRKASDPDPPGPACGARPTS